MSFTPSVKVSVVIPVYNKEPYVEKCLRSIMTQNFPSFEAIAVDDGSTDSSGYVCDRMAREYPSLKVFHRHNAGVTAARRFGVDNSQGRYIMFVDSDDQLRPAAISTLYEAIERTGADEVLGSAIDQYGKPIMKSGLSGNVDPDWMLSQLLASRASFPVLWAVIFRRELLHECLVAPPIICSGEDILMQIFCLVKKPKVVAIPNAVYNYVKDLPNDRSLNLPAQKAYDKMLRQAFASRWDELKDLFTLRQLKIYENFLAKGRLDVFQKYYRQTRSRLNRNIPLPERIVACLPPCLAAMLVRQRKFISSPR